MVLEHFLARRHRLAGTQQLPRFLLQAVLAGFLIKAFALLGLTLLVRFYAPLAEVCDALSFLVAFAATAIAILVPATLDTLRLLPQQTPVRR